MNAAHGLLTPAAIADDRQWSRQYAHRWLRNLERVHGARLVREGRRLYIERTELARVVTLLPKPVDPRIHRALAAIGDRLDAVEARQDGLAKELAEFRRKAHEWLSVARRPSTAR